MSETTTCQSCGALVEIVRSGDRTTSYRPIYNGDGTSSYRPLEQGPKSGARCGLCGARRPIERLPPLEISFEQFAATVKRAETAERAAANLERLVKLYKDQIRDWIEYGVSRPDMQAFLSDDPVEVDRLLSLGTKERAKRKRPT